VKAQNWGAPGSDNAVTQKALKFGKEALREKFLEIYNAVLQTLQPPTQWQINIKG